MKVKGKTIAITGGGDGIGRQLVLQLLQKGANVAALDLNKGALEETGQLAGEFSSRLSIHTVDVSDKSAVESLPEAVRQSHGHIDGIINNAGIIQPFIRLNELEYDSIDKVLDVNLKGVIYMTKTFLPYLLERPEGHVVNVSSMGGFFPFPGQTLYGASKAAVKILTEGLYSELIDSNVRVTVVFPGAVSTNITKNSGLEMAPNSNDEASKFPATSPEDAAGQIIKGMEDNKFRVMVGKDARLMDYFYRLSPKRAVHYIHKKMKDFLPKHQG